MYKAGQSIFADKPAQVSNHAQGAYPLPLSFYDDPPLFDVTIEDFETCALDRLRVLAEIEACAARNRNWDEVKTITLSQCKKYIPLGQSLPRSEAEALRKRDHLSHFVLRLAFCRSDDLQRRFIKAETTLFKVRYDELIASEREQFLSIRNFHWILVGEDEQQRLKTELSAAYTRPKGEPEKDEVYYKVKWTRVPDLVEKRRVLLKGGWAYLPARDLPSVIFQEFEDHLRKALDMTARMLPRLDEDTRLIPLLNNLSQGFLAGVSSEWAGSNETANGNEIKAEMVNSLAPKHFPLCMRTLHESLQEDNHLKYFGRLEYGLFLKVLGLSIEEAVTFWRRSFSRMTDDKFNKEYRYNIRHSYGLEGRRANYPAKSCVQLLAPGSSDHGCPYRNYSPENLQSALLTLYTQRGLRSADLPEVMATVKAGHYHVACTRVFELTHGIRKGDGVGSGESVTHPNQYAAKSMELEKKKSAMEVE